jgi:hypothetical protein
MHPDTMYELAKLKIAEDHAYAARQRLAREAQRSAAFTGHVEPSLLERVAGALRRAAKPSTRPSGRIATAAD